MANPEAAFDLLSTGLFDTGSGFDELDEALQALALAAQEYADAARRVISAKQTCHGHVAQLRLTADGLAFDGSETSPLKRGSPDPAAAAGAGRGAAEGGALAALPPSAAAQGLAAAVAAARSAEGRVAPECVRAQDQLVGLRRMVGSAPLNARRRHNERHCLPLRALAAKGAGLVFDELSVPTLWRLRRVSRAMRELCGAALARVPSIIVCGGFASSSLTATESLSFSPGNLAWNPIAELNVPRHGAVAAMLSDGRVLVAGGIDNRGVARTAEAAEWKDSAEIFDSSAEQPEWMSLYDRCCSARAHGSCAALPDGRLMLLGGRDGTGRSDAARRTEIFDPASKSWSSSAPMMHGRSQFAAVARADGSVVAAGGSDAEYDDAGGTAEIWRPAQQAWEQLPGMMQGRQHCCGCLMADGRVVVMGGCDVDGIALETVEGFDGQRWQELAPMCTPRASSAACTLRGDMLVAGGSDGAAALRSVELFDVEAGRWRVLPQMSNAIHHHALSTCHPRDGDSSNTTQDSGFFASS